MKEFWDQIKYQLLYIGVFFAVLFATDKPYLAIASYVAIYLVVIFWTKKKLLKEQNKHNVDFKVKYADQLSKNDMLKDIVTEEFSVKPDEILIDEFGIPSFYSPMVYSVFFDFGDSHHNVEFEFICNIKQSKLLEPELESFVDAWNKNHEEEKITLEASATKNWYKKEYKKYLLDTAQVEINMFIPLSSEKETYKKFLHELRLFVDAHAQLILHREFLLSNDTRLIYRGHYLEEATLKGGALGKAKANDLYGNLFSMMCRVKKMDFIHLKKFRDFDS